MAAHHVELPEQVVSPGEELWVKIIDIDLDRRRISLSIKQAAEGGEVAEEYREAFGEHAYDAEGNYIGDYDYSNVEFTPETEAQAAWADYVVEATSELVSAPATDAPADESAATDAVEAPVEDSAAPAEDTAADVPAVAAVEAPAEEAETEVPAAEATEES
jgi:small subunit ribosomal protein S1